MGHMRATGVPQAGHRRATGGPQAAVAAAAAAAAVRQASVAVPVGSAAMVSIGQRPSSRHARGVWELG